VVQRFLPLASTDRDCFDVLARPCDRHPGVLAKSARQRPHIALKHAYAANFGNSCRKLVFLYVID
jgi:hypothetical protein